MNRTIEQTVKLRNQLCQSKGIKYLKVFDTNEHEPDKDVILGRWKNKSVVLRVGEHRPLNFYPSGYRGKYFVVPKLYFIDQRKNYEIEEFLPGKLFCDFFKKPRYNKLFSSRKWVIRLIQAFWEFQKVAQKIKLPITYHKAEMIQKFYRYAKKSILLKQRQKVENIINGKKYDFFWSRFYPCKWKYSNDNLLALLDGKIGFIDLVKVSRRTWGYDLGWLYWPQWFHFSLADFKKSQKHFSFLMKFYDQVYNLAPEREKRNKKLFYLKCYLGLLERIIGAMYDLNHKVRHTRKMTFKQKRAMMVFLKNLLTLVLERID